ncbi:hypothetical protein [Streptomyces sp. B6B3]|uniref:hypothetical protein n=1 Tax=Streptomyces sp. B6B3 TaxID=3153570 RepID=UPI00325DF922
MTVTRDRSACARVALWRPTRREPAALDVHLRVEIDGSGRSSGCAERADVLCLRAPERAIAPAAAAVDRLLHRFPGCLVALVPASPGGCVVGARDGARMAAVPDTRTQRRMTARERASLASFLHGQLVVGRSWRPRPGRAAARLVLVERTARGPLALRLLPLADALAE